MKNTLITLKPFLVLIFISFLFMGYETEIIKTETFSEFKFKESDLPVQGHSKTFFFIPEPGEMNRFAHVPYSGNDSMIVDFHQDLQAYDSAYSIVPKWKEQFGLPQWSEAVVWANDSGQTSFAVMPFLEDGSTELQTIFVLARYQGYWFFENWSARLLEKAIETEGEPDDKTQTLIDFYNLYINGYWDSNNGSEAMSYQGSVCQNFYFFYHGRECLEICLYCASQPFISIDCVNPYELIVDVSMEDCAGRLEGGGSGEGESSPPPQLNLGGWNPYF